MSTDATVRFFETLPGTGQPVSRRVSGRLRIDIRDDSDLDQWLVELGAGTARVFHRGGRADAVIAADRRLFDRIVTGRANPMAAVLRGALTFEGDIHLLAQFQRLLPGPPEPRRAPRAGS